MTFTSSLPAKPKSASSQLLIEEQERLREISVAVTADATSEDKCYIHGGFDELGAAVIFLTLVSLIVSAAYLKFGWLHGPVTRRHHLGELCCFVGAVLDAMSFT